MATTHSNSILGRPRDAASTRLLQSGLRVFGEHGFHGVSTRELAQAAGVNVAQIAYYFGGKEGYYLAVARHLVDRYATPLGALADQARQGLEASPADRTSDRTWLERLLGAAARALLAHSDAQHVVAFVQREQLQPTAAFDVLYDGLIRPLHEAFSLLASRFAGSAADDPATILRAHALLGQVLAFATARATLMRRLGWQSYAPEQIDQIAGIAAEFACRAFAVALPAAPAGSIGAETAPGDRQ